MELVVTEEKDIRILYVPMDRLDAGNSDEFKKACDPFLKNGGKVILEISKLIFVDSSGLGAILSCLRKLTAAQGDLKVCGMTKQVRLLFELVRMHRVIDVYNTADEAIEAFSQ